MVSFAKNIRLGRQVALKFLPDELTSEPIALECLRLEASSGLWAEPSKHLHYLRDRGTRRRAVRPHGSAVGRILRDKISGASLSASEVLDYAAAHRKGIVHRDIKPAQHFHTKHGYRRGAPRAFVFFES
jgi:serine/threonine protein kinase